MATFQKRIKYGYYLGPRVFVDALPLAASVVLSNAGGKFCTVDANGRLAISVAGDTQIFGWLELGLSPTAPALSATAGVETGQVDISPYALYLMPTNAAPTTTSIQKVCDLIVSSNVQKVNAAASAVKVLKMYQVDVTNSFATVGMNPAQQVQALAP